MSRLSLSLRLLGFFSLVGLSVVEVESADDSRLQSAPPQHVDVDPATGSSAAVVVGAVGLVHTSQLFPFDAQGQVIAAGNPAEQFDGLLGRLERLISRSAKGWDKVVKLNICVADNSAAESVRSVLGKKFSGPEKPATSFVVGKLARPGASVAVDAVIIDETGSNDAVKRWKAEPPLSGTLNGSDAARLPPGRRVYISGQAEASKDAAEATRLTLESLKRTLTHLDLTLDHVVQIKSFLGPISAIGDAEREIVKFFGAAPTPPLVFVEWSSSLPIEIELIAWGGPTPSNVESAVEYVTPPGMTASPVFCRVTRVNAPETIYISGLYGTTPMNGAEETREIFGTLEKILDKTGSDFRHLAKATYYVSTEEASTKLNEIRPSYYDPKRPPAASKAIVAGTGKAGRTITLDMIAVRKRIPPD
jgi:enamine deaminase RidA (YjgF/YER057c/UK114 family)